MKRLVLAAAFASSLPLLAGTHTWTGAVSGSWANPGNWSGGSPAGDPSSDLVFPSGAANLANLDDIPGTLYVASLQIRDAYTIGAQPGCGIALAGEIDGSPSASTVTLPIVLQAGEHILYVGPMSFDGPLSGPGSVLCWIGCKAIFSADNTYTGATQVSAGSFGPGDLEVDGSQPGSAANVSGSSSSGPAVLRGSGTVGPLAAQNGGQIRPGRADGPGSLTVAGDATLSPGGVLVVDLNGTAVGTQYDRLVVQGAATLSGGSLTLHVGYVASPGDAFTILTSASGIVGTFSGLAEGAILAAGCQNFQIHYGTNDVVLTRVSGGPPPLTSVTAVLSGPATVCTNSAGGTATAHDSAGCDAWASHQWGFRTTSGGTITPIAGATASTYVVSGSDFGAGSFFLVETTTPAQGSPVISNELAVTVLQAPTAVASGSATICTGRTATLSGSGGSLCSWSPATGLSDPYSCGPVASPAATTTYTLTVTAGSCASTNAPTVTVTVGPPCATRFYALPPCRLLDTRDAATPFAPFETRELAVAGSCGVPPEAISIAANVTVVNPAAPGFLRLYPAGTPVPVTSTLNFSAGRVRANNAVVSLAADGSGLAVENGSAGTTDLIVDVSGYFR